MSEGFPFKKRVIQGIEAGVLATAAALSPAPADAAPQKPVEAAHAEGRASESFFKLYPNRKKEGYRVTIDKKHTVQIEVKGTPLTSFPLALPEGDLSTLSRRINTIEPDPRAVEQAILAQFLPPIDTEQKNVHTFFTPRGSAAFTVLHVVFEADNQIVHEPTGTEVWRVPDNAAYTLRVRGLLSEPGACVKLSLPGRSEGAVYELRPEGTSTVSWKRLEGVTEFPADCQ